MERLTTLFLLGFLGGKKIHLFFSSLIQVILILLEQVLLHTLLVMI